MYNKNMDTSLAAKKCMPCEVGQPPMTADQISKIKDQIDPEWKVEGAGVGAKIKREFKFKNFKEALAFVNKVGEIAEQEGHHPDLTIYNYKFVRVQLTTHFIKGLSENDFILAAKIDQLPV